MRAAVPVAGSRLLSLQGITKRFGGVVALDGVNFELRAGEIHALLGENGAGKSTLINILGGIHQPDAGSLRVDGHPVRIPDVASADRLGIRVIHQELSLAPNLSVAENLFLGREPTRWGLLDRRQMLRQAEVLTRELGLVEIGRVEARVADLSVAQQQMVEIARALVVKARILILDEPTASLSAGETETLFARLDLLRAQGVGLIYITHRLEEVQRLADRITVLRDGRSIGCQTAGGFDQDQLIRWMVGRDLEEHYPRAAWKPGPVALRARNLRNARVHGVTFEVRSGEVYGLAGLVGAGRTELARALFGLDPLLDGEIQIEGKPVHIRNPSEARAAGMVMVPEDRKRAGLVMTESVAFNLALPWTRLWISGIRPRLQDRTSIVDRAIRRFGIHLADTAQPIGSLSGGNQQKVVVGKWMERPPKVLILDEPTRGIDVGARQEMFSTIQALVEEGLAVILISSDLPEVLNLSHRLAICREGRIVREAIAGEVTAEEVMAELTRSLAHHPLPA